jgi:hypothetical protein
MQYKVYKTILLFLLFNNPIIAQVFGGDFFIKYDSVNYVLTGYGIDNDKLENNKELKFKAKEIRNIIYNKINFISFQDTTENKAVQFYETIVLKLQCKNKIKQEMLVFITGKFDDRFNYLTNLEFKEGVYSIFIPTIEKEQLKLKRSDIVAGGTDITDLMIKM